MPKVNADALANGIMTPDPAGGKAYILSHPGSDPNQLEYFLGEFDLLTLAPGTSLDLYEVQGIPQHVVRWNNSSDGTRAWLYYQEVQLPVLAMHRGRWTIVRDLFPAVAEAVIFSRR